MGEIDHSRSTHAGQNEDYTDSLVGARSHRPRLSRRKKLLFALIVWSLCLVAFLALAEVIVRQKGLRPWTGDPRTTQMEPPGIYYRPHPTLGFLPRPGKTKITLPGPFSFTATHLPNGLRITHPLDTYPAAAKKEIWIFGCSFTHGWSLNDEQTYPWLLQEQLPGYEVVNFGGDGFSTVQSLVQLHEALAEGRRPALIILAYASIHDFRNTLTRTWMKLKAPIRYPEWWSPGSISLPYVEWAPGKPEIRYKPLDYRGVPLLHYSAFANYLDDTYNRSIEESYQSHEVSKKIIEDIATVCGAHQIEFVVAGLLNDAPTLEMLGHLNRKGIKTVDMSVDLRIRENNNLPYDAHPSALANQQYAQKLKTFLCGKVITDPSCGK